MTIRLEAVGGKSAGRTIPVVANRPRIFKVVKQGRDAGEVTVELVDGRCVVTNRSERPVLVNGKERDRAVLGHGDTVVIGKDTFGVVDSEPPTESLRASGYHPTPTAAGDHATGGLEVVEPDSKPAGEADPHRRRKSISASMHSVVEPEAKPNLLNRMSSVFSARSRADRSREEELQRERTRLLEEAGRQVLAGHALGLPEQVFSDLLAGKAVTIRPEEVSRGSLDRWRELTQRVSLLDAEIAAVRRTLGLGPDLGAVRLSAPMARNQLRKQEERAFATLDALTTQELGTDPPTAVTPAPPTSKPVPAAAPSSVSGRSRVSGRRRHH